MINLIRADLFKMYKSGMIKILFLITLCCAGLMALMAHMISQGNLSVSMSGITFMFADTNMMSILGAMIAGVFICGDFDNKTIHSAISSGHSRGTVIIAKSIVFMVANLVLLLPYAIITSVVTGMGLGFDMGGASVGFSYMLTTTVFESGSAMLFMKQIAAVLVLILVIVSQLCLCVPLAILIRKPVLVIAIYYGFSILSGQLMLLSKNSLVLDKLISFTPYAGSHPFITVQSPVLDFIKAISVSVLFIIIMIAITFSIFRKSDIK